MSLLPIELNESRRNEICSNSTLSCRQSGDQPRRPIKICPNPIKNRPPRPSAGINLFETEVRGDFPGAAELLSGPFPRIDIERGAPTDGLAIPRIRDADAAEQWEDCFNALSRRWPGREICGLREFTARHSKSEIPHPKSSSLPRLRFGLVFGPQDAIYAFYPNLTLTKLCRLVIKRPVTQIVMAGRQ